MGNNKKTLADLKSLDEKGKNDYVEKLTNSLPDGVLESLAHGDDDEGIPDLPDEVIERLVHEKGNEGIPNLPDEVIDAMLHEEGYERFPNLPDNVIGTLIHGRGKQAIPKSNQKSVNPNIRDFVYYMIHNKGLTKAQQAKIDKLLSESLNTKHSNNPSPTPPIKKSNLNICTTHFPKKIVSFLHKFTDKQYEALKYTTHTWDKDPDKEEYPFKDFEDFKSKYQKNLEDGQYTLSDMHDLCEHLWRTIRNFLINNEAQYPWSEYKLKLGYNKYLREWMNANPGLQPASMPISAFPKEIQPNGLINGRVLSYFGNVIDIFKHCIEFRDNDLFKYVKNVFTNPDFKLDMPLLETLRGRTFYTDTELVKEALRLIAGNIFHRSEYPELKISTQLVNIDKSDAIELRILHVNSFSNKDINTPKIKAISDEGDLSRIKSKLTNLCDFSVESTFRIDGNLRHCRINYLSSKEKEEGIVLLDDIECEGFTYILTFYIYKHE